MLVYPSEGRNSSKTRANQTNVYLRTPVLPCHNQIETLPWDITFNAGEERPLPRTQPAATLNYPPCHHQLDMFNPPGILLNFSQLASQFAGRSEFSTHHEVPSPPPDLAEKLHHTLIGILLLEAAFVYLLISALFQRPEENDEVRRIFARWFRFCSITILDACTIIVHTVVVNEETSTPYSLRLDGYLLMCLNLALLCILP